MADKLSNNKDRADHEHEDHVFKSTSDSSTDLDHLQEYFDATAPSNSSQNDTTLQASKASPNQQPESEKNQQASEAFNDLANAFAIESKPSPNATVENSKEDLEVSLPNSRHFIKQAHKMTLTPAILTSLIGRPITHLQSITCLKTLMSMKSKSKL